VINLLSGRKIPEGEWEEWHGIILADEEIRDLARMAVWIESARQRLGEHNWCEGSSIYYRDCVNQARRLQEKVAGYNELLLLAMDGIVEKVWEDLRTPVTYPAVYSGPVEISNSGCGSCSGTDTWKITLKGDGTLTVEMTFTTWINGPNSCEVRLDNPRTRAGTYDANAKTFHITHPEYPISGHYDNGRLTGSGYSSGIGCNTAYDMDLRHVQ
jgi:hypothetical protein